MTVCKRKRREVSQKLYISESERFQRKRLEEFNKWCNKTKGHSVGFSERAFHILCHAHDLWPSDNVDDLEIDLGEQHYEQKL